TAKAIDMVQAHQLPGACPAGQALPGSMRPGILVVDDEAAVRQVLALVLAHAGFDVWGAATGEEAVALWTGCGPGLREAAAPEGRPQGLGGGARCGLPARRAA